MTDLNISGSACSINCNCSRWSSDNYTFIIETWLKKSDYQDLRDSIRPGACGELYKILGRPYFVDKSWDGSNTLTFTPKAGSQLANMRSEKLGYVRNITSSPLPGDKGHIFVKLDCFVSGMGDL
jgi:hypothetical protein